jgi:hypothetical protein
LCLKRRSRKQIFERFSWFNEFKFFVPQEKLGLSLDFLLLEMMTDWSLLKTIAPADHESELKEESYKTSSGDLRGITLADHLETWSVRLFLWRKDEYSPRDHPGCDFCCSLMILNWCGKWGRFSFGKNLKTGTLGKIQLILNSRQEKRVAHLRTVFTLWFDPWEKQAGHDVVAREGSPLLEGMLE